MYDSIFWDPKKGFKGQFKSDKNIYMYSLYIDK